MPRVVESRTRGHRFTVRGERFNRNMRSNLLIQRVLCVRNELLEEVVEAGTFATFKKHLDRYIDRIDLGGYGPKTQVGGTSVDQACWAV